MTSWAKTVLAGVAILGLLALWLGWPSDGDDGAPVGASVEVESDESEVIVAAEPEALDPARSKSPLEPAAGPDAGLAAQSDPVSTTDRRIEQPSVRRASERAARLREATRDADALPAERRFLTGPRLDMRTFRDVLGSEEFLDAFHELAADSMADNDALALTDVYADFAEQVFGQHGQFALDRMACGLRMCMGQAVALSNEANWSLHGLSPLGDGPPMPASAANVWIGPNGQRFYQFLFTNDPESRGIVVSGP